MTLSITLLFRFLPLLAAEWQRYALIAAARGKLAAKPGKVPAGMIYRVVLPFLISAVRMADSVADALEARGIGSGLSRKTRAFKLSLTAADYVIAAGAATLWALLMLLRKS